MLTRSQIVESLKKPRKKVSDDDLRSLPYLEASIYGRLSTPGQVRDSKESIREIAKLVKLAIQDGYQTDLDPVRVEAWLEDIGKGNSSKGVMQGGQVTVDVRDLGISGQLAGEDRKGMADLQKRITDGKVGAVYITEGVSRLSRDRDHILPYQLLKIMRDCQVRVRTPEGVWNPAIERDYAYLADEFDQAIAELKVMNKRMFLRKAQKAARGEYVGEPVPLGFIVPIVGRKTNGQYEYGKYVPYPPHADMAKILLQEFVRASGSPTNTMKAVKDMAIPFFPPDLGYMEHLSSLRKCGNLANGYEISPNLVFNLAKNPKLIGVWRWGDGEPILDNHPAAVPEDLFSEAFAIATRKGKPKGRAAASEPLEWMGLLYCMNHAEKKRVTSRGVSGNYSCERDYKYGRGPSCFYIKACFLDEPLSQAVLSQLELGPCVEEIIARLQDDALSSRLDQVRDRQQISLLEKEIKNLKALLPCCVDETGTVDREKEKHYWEEIRAAERQLQELRGKPITGKASTTPDYGKVRDFLENLPTKWRTYSHSSRNRFLKALIDRVELIGEGDIQATLYWKAGFKQTIVIHRNRSKKLVERLWTESEDNTLRRVFHTSPKDVVVDGLPGRSWKSITLRAIRLGLKRKRGLSVPMDNSPDRCEDIHQQDMKTGTRLLPVVLNGPGYVTLESQNLDLPQGLSSGRLRGIFDFRSDNGLEWQREA